MELFHVTPRFNVPNILREGLVPQIGANSLAAGEIRPGIYLFQNWMAAEDALLNWLGEKFEDIPLSVLRVHASEEFLIHEPESFEYICQVSIPPKDIQEIATF